MRTILITLVISAISISTATAEDYFPLKEGNEWIYSMSNGVQTTVKVTGFSEVKSVRCAVVESAAQSIMGKEVSTEYLAVDSQAEMQTRPMQRRPR